jgi:SAM-dependent methyltransferase
MKHNAADAPRAYELTPSPFVKRFISRIAKASFGKAVLDVACGSGRNAMPFAQLGCNVICIDKDLASFKFQRLRLRGTSAGRSFNGISLRQVDLCRDLWPFGACAFGSIINVHFLLPSLFPAFENSLSPGGYLLIETVPGCGGNYLQLPKVGEVISAFERAFVIECYKERKVGPPGHEAVTVHMLAKKKSALEVNVTQG